MSRNSAQPYDMGSIIYQNLTNTLTGVADCEGLGIQLDIDYHELQIKRSSRTSQQLKNANEW